jgi:hypothetical protein
MGAAETVEETTPVPRMILGVPEIQVVAPLMRVPF